MNTITAPHGELVVLERQHYDKEDTVINWSSSISEKPIFKFQWAFSPPLDSCNETKTFFGADVTLYWWRGVLFASIGLIASNFCIMRVIT
jgi:hypothetical protein